MGLQIGFEFATATRILFGSGVSKELLKIAAEFGSISREKDLQF